MTPDEMTEMVGQLLAKSIQIQPGGTCCMDESWRGRPCTYHDGFEDGIWATLEAIEEGDPT